MTIKPRRSRQKIDLGHSEKPDDADRGAASLKQQTPSCEEIEIIDRNVTLRRKALQDLSKK